MTASSRRKCRSSGTESATPASYYWAAGDAWLRGHLWDDVLNDGWNKVAVLKPAGLPLTNSQQATIQALNRKIGQQLHVRTAAHDGAISAMQKIETVGEWAGYAAGVAGLAEVGITITKTALKQAAKQGLLQASKKAAWSVAKVGTVIGGTIVAGREVVAGARAAGASEQTIRGIQLATLVVGVILLRRRAPAAVQEAAATEAAAESATVPAVGAARDAAQFEALAQRRVQLDLPPAGTAADAATLARLEINGRTFEGINRSLQSPLNEMTLQRVNAQTLTHAEADVVQQAVEAGMQRTATRAEMWVDRDPCGACGRSGGLRSLARNLGVDELIVHSPSGTQTVSPTR